MQIALTPNTQRLLRLADSALVLAQRNGEWCGHAPVLEEDLALANGALDLLGQARALLSLAGRPDGLDEDQLAMLRLEHQFLNPVMFELPHAADGRTPGDFAFTTLRNLCAAAWFTLHWQRLSGDADAELAAIAAKALKESRYHFEHASDWAERLGDGTPESHARMQAALERLWPYVGELFAMDEWAPLEAPWREQVLPVLAAATLALPKDRPNAHFGHQGRHSEHLGHLLAEMQYLQRAYPGGRW
ncbi:1,2-phenylacetyl-CoA epoxidase subunit PaaC [Inhella sp.]|uniref:1,2-phenylacetyl-CoA epoxidase subunit PaaC n=1 Tax=Inhella sp. TaxID=1921806 RepID=UPI0035AF7EA7